MIRIALLATASLLGGISPASGALPPPVLTLSKISIENQSSPKVKQLTAGYMGNVRFDTAWSGGFRDYAKLEILIDSETVLNETLNFRDDLGTFQSHFYRYIRLPVTLARGSHKLIVRCSPAGIGGGSSAPDFAPATGAITFTADGVAAASVTTPSIPPASSEPALTDEQWVELYRQRVHRTTEALARALCNHYGASYVPARLLDSWTQKTDNVVLGLDDGKPSTTYKFDQGTKGLTKIEVRSFHELQTPQRLERLRKTIERYPLDAAEKKQAAWSGELNAAGQPVFAFFDVKFNSAEDYRKTMPKPPAYSVRFGDTRITANGEWTSGPHGTQISVIVAGAVSPFANVVVSTDMKIPASESERIRRSIVGDAKKITRAQMDQIDAATKKARQDAGRELLAFASQAIAVYAPLLLDGTVDATREQKLASMTLGRSAESTPTASTLPTKPSTPATPSTPSIGLPPGFTGARGGSAAKPPPPAPTNLGQLLTQLGQESATRAAAVVTQAVPNADGLAPAEVEILAEAALTNSDPATVQQELAAEQQALVESGSGDALKVLDATPEPAQPDPGQTVTVSVTVRNQAAAGAPAVFDLSLTDYHDNNRNVAVLNRRSLAPGATARYTLKFTAPRAYNFGGYATVEPVVFAGDTYPFQVVNLKINWDGSTMTDEEIVAELRDRNPCPDDFPLTGDRLTHFVALYRADSLQAVAALENEAIAAQRDRMQADLDARLNDPARLEQIHADLDAAANTKLLAAYETLRKLAREWGYIHDLNLLAILDDAVYIDTNAKVHGNLAAARQRIFRAIEEKQAGTTAMQRLLLADPNDKSGTTSQYRAMEPVASPGLALAGLANLDSAATDAVSKALLKRVTDSYRELQAAYSNANTSVTDFNRYRNALRECMAECRSKLNTRDSSFYWDVLDDARKKLSKLDAISEQARTFQTKANRLLAGSRAAKTVGNTLSNVGDIWAVYEMSEKVLARTNGGEDFVSAVGKEAGNWGAKKMLFACPVIGAADTVMSATGHILKNLGPEYWEEAGIDPTQYNASALVDIGTGVTFAGVEDMGTILAKRWNRNPALTPDERAQLEARLKALEERIDATTDDALRQRLLTSRTYVRQTLRER